MSSSERSDDPCTDFCSLPPEEVRERAAFIRADLLPRVLHEERAAGRVAWEFYDSPELSAKLEEFVEFERRCCAGLTFDLERIAENERIRLTIAGDGADTIGALGDDAPPRPARGGARRALRAGGVGLGVSLLICCVLPIGVAAIAGAAAAAPLVILDDPLYIGIGGILFGVTAWLSMKRRDDAFCADC